eukprot:jgi/Mesen1/1583/ME000134S00701
MEAIQEQLTSLLLSQLYESAELLKLYGDALAGRKEFKRALTWYRQAQQLLRVGGGRPHSAAAHHMRGVSTAASHNKQHPPSPNSAAAAGPALEIDLKLRVAQCCAALKDTRTALSENPYAVEAIVALAKLGAPAKDIHSLLPQVAHAKATRRHAATAGNDLLDPARWLPRLADLHCCMASHDYIGAGEHARTLQHTFPANFHLTLHAARAEAAQAKDSSARVLFKQARAADACAVEGMDEYAMLLLDCPAHGPASATPAAATPPSLSPALGRLASDLLQLGPARPQAWTACAALAEQQPLVLPQVHGGCGRCLRRVTFAGPAAQAASGLVFSYLAGGRLKEALVAARQSSEAFPASSQPLVLIGSVYIAYNDGNTKARRYMEQAVKQDPKLKQRVAVAPTEAAHIKLADSYTALAAYSDAMCHYEMALRHRLTTCLHSCWARQGRPREELEAPHELRAQCEVSGLDPDDVNGEDGPQAHGGAGNGGSARAAF